MPDKLNNFLKELKHRKVYKVATVYAITGWIIVQVVDVTFPRLNLPDWWITAVIVFVLIGFPVALVLAWAFEMSPEGIVRSSSIEAKNNTLPAHKRKPFTGTTTIVILAVLLIGQFIYFQFIRDSASNKDIAAIETTMLSQKSIAVLPFKNLSKEEDNAYFCDGVMEAILNNLSRIKDLKVVSRTSVERFRDQDTPIPDIANELEVANIMEGSVQRIGNNVRITVQLISAEKDEHIWATQYDRDISDIFVVQSEIAKTIAENLEVILTAEERGIIENAPTANLKAYDLFLETKNQKRYSKKDIENVIEKYKMVISMDNNFSLAYANLGENLYKLGRFGASESIWVDSALSVLDKALLLDPTNANAYRYKSFVFKGLHQEEKVKENLLNAIKYDPNNFFNFKYLGQYYQRTGQVDLSIDYMLKSWAVNKPDDDDEFYSQMGKVFINIDWKLVKKYCRKGLESNYDFPDMLDYLARIAFREQNYEEVLQYALKIEAVDAEKNYSSPIAYGFVLNKQYNESFKYFNKAIKIDEEENTATGNQWYLPFYAYAKIKSGKTLEGKDMLKAYFEKVVPATKTYDINTEVGFNSCVGLARKFAWENNKSEAIAWLEKSVEDAKNGYTFFWMFWLMSDPFFDDYRDDDGFKKVIQTVKDEEENRRQLLLTKLAEYHARKELKWLKQDE